MRFTFNSWGSGTRGPLGSGLSFVGKVVNSIGFLIFAAAGVFFIVMMFRGFFDEGQPWFAWLFLILPLVFIAVGLGGVYSIWFRKAKGKAEMLKGKHSTLQTGKTGGVVFGCIFMAAGLGFFYGFGVRPFLKTMSAKDWIETPCRIISAEVGSHSDSDGTTYSIDITYEYQVDGKIYRSDRYSFMGGSSSGYEGKQKVVDRYRRMPRPVCYVDPDDPSEAVLMRDLTSENAIGLFPLIFVGAGAAVAVVSLKKGRRGKGPAWLPRMKEAEDDDTENPYAFSQSELDSEMDDDSITLAPRNTALKKMIGILIFCLFWNGIVSVFLFHMIQGHRSGDPDWGLTLFLIPFELVGLGTLGGVFYYLLALLNPRYTLTLTPGRLYPGMVGQIGWQARGKAERIRELKITLTGREEATYRVGTNTKTEKETFYEMNLLQTDDPYEIAGGEVGFGIPSGTMHSFEAANNKIVWSIVLHGDIARWPDTKQEYGITICPAAMNTQEVQR